MIGYTCVGTNHLDNAVRFYSELLSLLGAKPPLSNRARGGLGHQSRQAHAERHETL